MPVIRRPANQAVPDWLYDTLSVPMVGTTIQRGGSAALDALKRMGLEIAEDVPTSVRGAVQGAPVSRYGANASLEAGRGGASMEALSRAAGERLAGKTPMMRGPGGVLRPYVGDAADAVVNPGWEIGYRLPTGGWEKIR